MKLRHLFILNRCRSLTNNTLKSATRYLSSPTIPLNAPTIRITNHTNPISTFTRKLHSVEHTLVATDSEEDDNEEDATMTEFLSRFVWIMRGKLNHAYPGVNKDTINGMLLIIVEKIVEELEKDGGDGLRELMRGGLDTVSVSDDFSEELWKTVWEVSKNVLQDMDKARKKEEMKKYIQCDEVKEMCRFASEVGVRGNMLREFRFKWAKEKMEEAECYQRLDEMRAQEHEEEEEWSTEEEEVKEGEAEQMSESEKTSEAEQMSESEKTSEAEQMSESEAEQMSESEKLKMAENGSYVETEVKPRVISLPQRRGKLKYKIYGLDLSDPKWAQVADNIHEPEKLITPEEPKPITGRCKLVTAKILHLGEGDDPSALLAEWIELLKPSRVDWFALLDRLKEANAALYLKVAELVLDEDSFQANIRDYSKLIDAHAKDNRMDDAERILQKMAEKNIQPDILISTILVHMYSKAGNTARATETFEWLRSQGFQPDMKVYDSMIMAYLNAGDLEHIKKAEILMREMEARDVKPSKEIFMALLGSYSKRGLTDGAFRVSTSMHFAGFQPTVESCTLLVEAYARANDADKAKREIDNMINLGLKPGDRCVATLISLYERQNLLDKALDLLLEVERDGFEPGIATYTVLLEWFSKLLLLDEAEEIFRRITEKGETPPLKVQVSLCDMYSRLKEEKKALQALGIVEGKKDLLEWGDFERIINGLVAGGLVQDALRIRGMMEARGFSASEPLKVSLLASQTFRHQRPGAR